MPSIKEQTIILIEKIRKYHIELNMKPLSELLTNKKNDLESNIMRLVVVGEVKKGKSSLINAVLDMDELLPQLSDVATSTCFKLKYGEKRENRVFFKQMPDIEKEELNESVDPESKVINDDELLAYGTEAGNTGNHKNVDFIEISLPSDVLKSGIEIIDTPGLGGLHRYHTEITWRYVPSADAVLFVLDSTDSPITKEEIKWIKKIQEINPALFFVQTKIDLTSETQWQAWQARNLKVISESIEQEEEKIQYFPVSSKYKSMSDDAESRLCQRSGFPAFSHFFFHRLPHEIVRVQCENLLRQIHPELAAKKLQLEEELAVLEEKSMTKLLKSKEDYQTRQSNLEQMESDTLPDLINRFTQDFENLKEESAEELGDLLQAHRLNPELTKFVHNINENEEAAKSINKKIDSLIEDFVDKISGKALKILEEKQKQIRLLVQDYIEELNENISKCMSSGQSDENPDHNVIVNDTDISNDNKTVIGTVDRILFDGWDYTRTIYIGGITGLAISGFITASLIALNITWPILALFPLFGGGMGALLSKFSTKKKRKKQVINYLQTLIPGVLSQLNRKTTGNFKKEMNKSKRQIVKVFKTSLRNIKDQNDNRLKLIQSQIDNEAQDNLRMKKKTSDQNKTVKNLLRHAQRIITQIQENKDII